MDEIRKQAILNVATPKASEYTTLEEKQNLLEERIQAEITRLNTQE